MNKLLSALIATVFAATLSFNAIAAKHMGAAPAEAPAATKDMKKEMKMEEKKEMKEMKEMKKEEKKAGK